MAPLGNTDLGQHWFRLWLGAWWHQTITWTNVDFLSVCSNANHLRVIPQEMTQPSVIEISLNITLKFLLNLLGYNELMNFIYIFHLSLQISRNCINYKFSQVVDSLQIGHTYHPCKLWLLCKSRKLCPSGTIYQRSLVEVFCSQQAIRTNADLLSICPLTNFGEIQINIQQFSFKKMYLKTAFAKVWPFCSRFYVFKLTPYLICIYSSYFIFGMIIPCFCQICFWNCSFTLCGKHISIFPSTLMHRSWDKIEWTFYFFLKISLKFVFGGPIDNEPALV